MPLDDEAQRRLGVAVRRRDFAGHDELQAGKQRLGDRRAIAEAGVLKDQDTPLGFLGGDEAGGFHQMRADDAVVVPMRRNRLGDGRAGDEAVQALP